MSAGSEIHVVGMASVYAGAGDIKELWETVLTRRRGFREFPRQRLQLSEYGSSSREDRDKTYIRRAAVIDGFEFDWKSHRIPKVVFEAADPVHWLALSTAINAIEEGAVDLDAVGRERCGVVIGNSLTGEVSRANLLRLRWPYVRQAIAAGAARRGLHGSDLTALVGEIEQSFKGAFPVPNEDTLAGVLSNVIAGRICNALDFNGGGYVVDGACASSLLAVNAGCEALEAGRLDLVVVGGVDISLDPLEMVGFARTGALTPGTMRVYDKDSSGFIPGEGCGMLVLMRGREVERFGLKTWAKIAGWGISSDGSGGITAPKASAQALAMRRCYERCGFGADSLDFIEGHGTGTSVGDRQELLGFLEMTSGEDRSDLRRTGLTSIKTLLGHTKAAAGAAGLIKAVLAVNQRVLPPMAGLQTRADAFSTPGARIYPISQGSCLPTEAGLRAGVSGAGFGGINCHIAITGEGIPKRELKTQDPSWLLASAQSAELFIASAVDIQGLSTRVEELLHVSAGMAEGELVDLAVDCALCDEAAALRMAVVAESVDQLRNRLAALAQVLKASGDELPSTPPGILLGRANPDLRIGCLFPGQGAQFVGMGRTLTKRIDWAARRRAHWDAQFAALGPLSAFIDRPLERANSAEIAARWDAALRDTLIAQPAIVMTSLQWLQWLRQVGITASAVAGHSLGEITALVAADLLSEVEAIDIVRIRARECAAEGVSRGGMLALKCGLESAQALVAATAGYAVVANDNAPDQVVVAGDPDALAAIAELADRREIDTVTLNVSKAFHTRHMAAAAGALESVASSRGEERSASVPFFSAVQGGLAPGRFDPFVYVAGQISAPVRFREAVTALATSCDMLVEVGPGSVLTGLVRKTLGNALPICALEPGQGDTDAQFCAAIGQLFVAGAPLDWEAFYADRYWRPFVPASERKFIENPCARNAGLDDALIEEADRRVIEADQESQSAAEFAFLDIPAEASIEDIIRELVARETGYDLEMIPPEARLSLDLNLDSIKIAEVRAELRARGIDLPEDLALGITPILGIARAAVRRQLPQAAREHNDVPPASGVLPKDLPVLGYVQTWLEAELDPSPPPIGSAMILHGAGRAEEAGLLAERLLEAGVRTGIDDGSQVLAGDPPMRLIGLPGGGATAVSEFFARLGEWVGAGIGSLVLASRPGQAPVFGFAQSLSLEMPVFPILAVEADSLAALTPLALTRIDPGARLLRVGADNACRSMALDRWTPPPTPNIPLQTGDVVVISGGGKGITAECAFALLQASRARALLLGTSSEDMPGAEVDGTLLRMAGAGLEAVYLQCDVTDPVSVARALRRGAERLGTSDIAGLVHGAGVNIPALAARLDPAALQREYAVKVDGLANLLAAVDAERLKLCVALGSVIGAVGMAGNCGYALANEAMAAVLADLKRRHPQMQVACAAYGVWAEVGMGAKLKVLAALEAQNIAAISIAEGTRWFLECCGQPDLPLPLVITATMHGLPTWRRARGTGSVSGLPYVDERVVHEPGVVLVSRPALNPARDGWLADHAFRGSLLFATVQALAAIATGARLLAGGGVTTRFADLQITRPIVVAQQGDTIIELDVRRVEGPALSRVEGPALSHVEGGDWVGRIGTPGNAWADPAFGAQCQLGTPDRGNAAMSSPDFAAPSISQDRAPPGFYEVSPEVGAHLYDAILFQGRSFQRIEDLLALDLSDDLRRRGRFRVHRVRSEPDAPVPDVFFLDAMLQCVQVLVPQDMCLPVGIDEMVFYAAAWDDGATLVEAEITERTATGYVTRVRAWNTADGAAVASYEGYRVSIVESHPARPDAHALFNPLAYDQATLEHWLSQSDRTGLNVALGRVDDADPQARRTAATSQLARQLGIAATLLRWGTDGAPMLSGRPGQGVSIAHDAGRLLSACGSGRVGCDLQRVGRAARPWAELLPAARIGLWRAVTGAMNDSDRAGAIVWAIHEALFKAGAVDAGVTFTGMRDSAPQFRLAGGEIVAGVLELVLAGPSAIALAQLPERNEFKRVTHYTRDIEMTFKEALPPLKSPTAPVFFEWMGKLREEAMSDIRPALVHSFGVGGKGMVTNGSRVRIARPVRFVAPLRAWVWLERVLTSQPSTFELGFQWAETGIDGVPRLIVAEGLQRLSWVDVEPGGHVTLAPFPEFFARFIAERLPSPEAGPFTPPLGAMPAQQLDEAVRWRCEQPTAGYGAARVRLETDETHSNFVGNIYFSHATALAERACQKSLRQMGNCPGGFFATAFQLDHLGEAMPGDRLEAEVRLSEVGATFCAFDMALVNQSQGGEKIAMGRSRYRLFAPVRSDTEGAVEDFAPQAMPEWLIPTHAEETP
ncbi:MAG: SDR family NAD(P)-dependent oxidoreductase [Methylococcaceae bacterium]|nr:SDR family NAD(P)-dependent oxidoreductase [Methylococcaceae bacterium]